MKTFLDQIEEEVLIVNQRGEIQFVAQKLCEKLGYTTMELTQMNIGEIMSCDYLESSLVNDSIEQYKQYPIQLKAKDKQKLSYKMQLFQAEWQGEESWYILGSKEDQSLKSEEDARCILEQLPVVIMVKNLHGAYTYMNKFGEEYFEYSPSEVIGKCDEELFGEKIGKLFGESDKQIIKGNPHKYVESCIKTKTGRVRLLQVDKFPLYNEQGEICGIIKMFKRKMVNKLVEKEKERKLDQLAKMIETRSDNIGQIEFSLPEYFSRAEILKELKAEGISVWIYNEECEKLECKLSMKENEKSINDSIGIQTIDQSITCKNRQSTYEGIRPIDEVDLVIVDSIACRKKLRDKGIRYMGVFNMTYENEFMGIINLLYKEYEPLDGEQERLARMAAKKMAQSIKQYKMSQRLAKELQNRTKIEKELQYLLEATSDGLWVTSLEKGVLKVSRGMCEMLGISAEEIQKNTLLNYVLEEDKSMMYYVIKLCKENPNQIQRLVTRMRHADGSTLWVECGGKYVPDRQIYVCTSKNVTKKYRLKEQKKVYHKKKQLEKLKNEFLANVSYEFRLPLASLLAKQEQISQMFSGSGVEKYSEYIRKNIYRLMRLVNNLIDVTHMIAGDYKIHLENCDIIGVVSEICSVAAAYASDKEITLSFQADCTKKIIECDPDKIERIVLNLLSNAIKYTPQGGHIEVELGVVEDKIMLIVQDNGIGIPKDQLESIFELFIQVDHSLTRQNEGSGIGLSLTKQLVELHQGSIYATSVLGEGTKINIELPDRVRAKQKQVVDRERLRAVRWERCRIEFADIYDLF